MRFLVTICARDSMPRRRPGGYAAPAASRGGAGICRMASRTATYPAGVGFVPSPHRNAHVRSALETHTPTPATDSALRPCRQARPCSDRSISVRRSSDKAAKPCGLSWSLLHDWYLDEYLAPRPSCLRKPQRPARRAARNPNFILHYTASYCAVLHYTAL